MQACGRASAGGGGGIAIGQQLCCCCLVARTLSFVVDVQVATLSCMAMILVMRIPAETHHLDLIWQALPHKARVLPARSARAAISAYFRMVQ